MLGKLVSLALAAAITAVSSLGSTCSSPMNLEVEASTHNEPYWLEKIKHQGISAFNEDPAGYKVFRNVKDYGAKGDGTTDDTDAINLAISEGNRCGLGCKSSTVTPAVVYFPQGTYVVSKPLVMYYYTQLIGDAKKRPTLVASEDFTGMAIIDVNPYTENGGQWYINQNTFFRAVRNFVLDTRRMPASATGTCLHWQVAQATALTNVDFQMSTEPGNNHQGIFMENGSGGFMNDLTFNGGKFGMWVGNQQFTVRNIVIKNAQTAIFMNWNWGWTFQDITVKDCQVAFDVNSAFGTAGALALVDTEIINTPIFVRYSTASEGKLTSSLVVLNAKLVNVPIAVQAAGTTVLEGGHYKKIDSWVQGNVYSGKNGTGQFVQGAVSGSRINGALLSNGKVFGKSRPQYEHYGLHQIVSVRDEGAKGDGRTDDTAAIKKIIAKYAGCKLIFFDAGTYVVTDTITIPPGTQIMGESWSVIAGRGKKFSDPNNPHVVVKVGEKGDRGMVEISDIIFSTIGPTGGAIVVEWNIHQDSNGSAGLWDSHIRIGGVEGTELDGGRCPEASRNGVECMGAYIGLHLTPKSSGYFEATWVWTADHDLDRDGDSKISIFTGRGTLSESQGPTWFVGTASEHFVIYQYNLVNAKNHYIGLMQTESPYYQPSPAVPEPFTFNEELNDPVYPNDLRSSWTLNVKRSSDITIVGAGLYSFFDSYSQACIETRSCQTQMVNIDSESSVNVYSLQTVGAVNMLSVDRKGVVKQADNVNGFASTMTFWSPRTRLTDEHSGLEIEIGVKLGKRRIVYTAEDE